MKALASSLPNQPALHAITEHLSSRAQDLGQTGRELNQAVINMVGAPREVATKALDDFNARLDNLLEGEWSWTGEALGKNRGRGSWCAACIVVVAQTHTA